MRIGILGHFGIGEKLLNGQTVKTKSLETGLCKYSDAQVMKIDSHGWRHAPIHLIKNIKNAFKQCDAIVMLPAHNGVRVFAPILMHYSRKYKKKVFYDVIGGWLPELLKNKRTLSKTLKCFDGIWVETSTMKNALCAQGFSNISVIPNFKDLAVLSRDELIYCDTAPYKLCMFSRVMKEKGIGTAIDTVCRVNDAIGHVALELDIYGQIDPQQTEWFDGVIAKAPPYIKYRGCAEPDKSVEILKDHFALIFPTHFYTEGIPGTIIDAYCAGVPVISAKWESFCDVIDEGKTGMGYPFDDTAALEALLHDIIKHPQIILEMKPFCLKKASCFLAKTVIETITSKI